MSPAASARGGRDEFLALPTVLAQSSALTSIGDRPLVVVTAAAAPDPGWLAAQENLPRLSTDSVHRVTGGRDPQLAHLRRRRRSVGQAILDVLGSVRGGTPLR